MGEKVQIDKITFDNIDSDDMIKAYLIVFINSM